MVDPYDFFVESCVCSRGELDQSKITMRMSEAQSLLGEKLLRAVPSENWYILFGQPQPAE